MATPTLTQPATRAPAQSLTCHFCGEPAFTSVLTPHLCEKHFELTLIKYRLARVGLRLSVANVAREIERPLSDYKFAIQAAELPELINQMTPEDYQPAA